MSDINTSGAEAADAQALHEQAEAEAFAAAVVLDVCEIPDRNSPDDQPEMMLVTGPELHSIVMRQFERLWEQRSLSQGGKP